MGGHEHGSEGAVRVNPFPAAAATWSPVASTPVLALTHSGIRVELIPLMHSLHSVGLTKNLRRCTTTYFLS